VTLHRRKSDWKIQRETSMFRAKLNPSLGGPPLTSPAGRAFALNAGRDSLIRPYSKSSLTLTLNEWRFNFNLSFSRVSMLFLNSWRVSSHIVRYDTSPPAIQKQQWHSREAQIESPLIECEWAFRIRALVYFWGTCSPVNLIYTGKDHSRLQRVISTSLLLSQPHNKDVLQQVV
jgi:hypothetical protein